MGTAKPLAPFNACLAFYETADNEHTTLDTSFIHTHFCIAYYRKISMGTLKSTAQTANVLGRKGGLLTL